MSDSIRRQAAIEAISSMFAPTPTQKDMVEDCLEIIENLPSAQPEITRCKDCIYYRWEIDMCDYPYATAHNVVHENDYCSKAERRTDERPD